jgi:hypothetical protein
MIDMQKKKADYVETIRENFTKILPAVYCKERMRYVTFIETEDGLTIAIKSNFTVTIELTYDTTRAENGLLVIKFTCCEIFEEMATIEGDYNYVHWYADGQSFNPHTTLSLDD